LHEKIPFFVDELDFLAGCALRGGNLQRASAGRKANYYVVAAKIAVAKLAHMSSMPLYYLELRELKKPFIVNYL